MVQVKRKTKETNVVITFPASKTEPSKVDLELLPPTLKGAPIYSAEIDFLSHMLGVISKYSDLNFSVSATGDNDHHLSEDIAITLGAALRKVTPDTCARYGFVVVPMDDVLVEVSVDLVERIYYEGPLPTTQYEHFFRSLSENMKCNIHVRVLRGKDEHHIIEASFKALGMCLRQAMVDSGDVFSTKGAAEWTIDE